MQCWRIEDTDDIQANIRRTALKSRYRPENAISWLGMCLGTYPVLGSGAVSRICCPGTTNSKMLGLETLPD